MSKRTPKEEYLGDGLYAEDCGGSIRLRAPRENGDHEVYLEPDVLYAFLKYVSKIHNVKITIKKADAEERR